MKLIKKIFNRSLNFILNNIVTNFILIIIRKDNLIKNRKNNWVKKEYNENVSLQENTGCSACIQELVNLSHDALKITTKNYLKNGDNILDIGCGPGLFLKDFSDDKKIFGIDLNKPFLEKAKQLIKNGVFINGNYLKIKLDEKMNLIYLFSVLMYIEPSNINKFFKKISNDLAENGILFIQYPHALQLKDIFFYDLSYVRYSPFLIEKIAKKYFTIIEHKHFFDDRKVNIYDSKYYYFPDGKNSRLDTLQNTYLLIAKKK